MPTLRRHRAPLPRHLLAAAGTATLLFDLPAQQQPPSVATAASDWLRRLDEAFAARDLAGYLKNFAPDHQGLHDVLQQRLADWLIDQPERRRTSTLVAPPQDRGARLVAHVRHQIADRDAGAPFLEQVYVVFARRGHELVPTIEVELPEAYAPCPGDQLFRCPPCNFEMGGLTQWLCVPVGDDRGRALESATFLLLGTDVTCELQIDVRPEPLPATTVIEHLTTTTARLPVQLEAGPVQPWQPPAMPTPPAGFSGSSRTLQLPDEQRGQLHVACLGRMSHSLLLRGRAGTFQEHAKAIAGLLATYRMIEVDCDRKELGALALAAHTGSRLEGVRFQNDRFRVECIGPEGSTAQLRAGGHAFQCLWSCPEQRGRLFLTGYAAPRDLPWNCAEADRVLTNLCKNAHVEVAEDSGWSEPAANGARQRDLVLLGPVNDAQPSPHRWLRALVFADLLVILDGCSPARDGGMLKARDSFRRK